MAVLSGDGRDDVPTTREVMVDLAYGEDGVEIVVRDASGAMVPIRVFGNRQSYAVFPLVSWDAETTHELSVTYSCGTESFAFTTTPAVPAVSPETVVGTWEIDAHSISMNEDTILFELASPELYPMAWEVLAVTADTLISDSRRPSGEDVGAGRGQDLCVPTVDVLGVPFGRNPSFQFESALPIRYSVDYRDSVPVVLQDGWMAATFGERWSLRFGGMVDTTVLDPVFDGSGPASPTCATRPTSSAEPARPARTAERPASRPAACCTSRDRGPGAEPRRADRRGHRGRPGVSVMPSRRPELRPELVVSVGETRIRSTPVSIRDSCGRGSRPPISAWRRLATPRDFFCFLNDRVCSLIIRQISTRGSSLPVLVAVGKLNRIAGDGASRPSGHRQQMTPLIRERDHCGDRSAR